MKIALLGPPGVGKGTQAAALSERLGVPVVSTGDIFREQIERGTPLGQAARRYIEQGKLVPDDLVLGIVWDRLAAADCQGGFILDGFPRTVRQAEALDEWLAGRNQRLLAVIDLEVPAGEIVRRLSNRRICPTCGRSYHLIHLPPQQDERCDLDGTPLVQREDDRPEVILRRLEEYHQRTEPVVEYYRRAGLLRSVSGLASPAAVTAAMMRELGQGQERPDAG